MRLDQDSTGRRAAGLLTDAFAERRLANCQFTDDSHHGAYADHCAVQSGTQLAQLSCAPYENGLI
jgi:hypothetical protein